MVDPIKQALDTDNVELLIESVEQSDVNTIVVSGVYGVFGLLVYSAAFKAHKCLRWLLDHGADPNLSLVNTWPPLYEAVSKGDLCAIELLLVYGAHANGINNQNGPVCFVSTINGERAYHIYMLLYEWGAQKRYGNYPDSDFAWKLICERMRRCKRSILAFWAAAKRAGVLPKDVCLETAKVVWAQRRKPICC